VKKVWLVNSRQLDLIILKYKNYIRRYPQKAYGYYCMGMLHLLSGEYKAAEEFLNKSLSMDNNLTRARIGIIESYICRNRYSRAVHYYNKHYFELNAKNVYKVKLARAVSSIHDNNRLYSKPSGLIHTLINKYEMQSIHSFYKKDPGNLLANLILCLDYIHTVMSGDRAAVVYNTCVYMDGLSDKLRWNVIKMISKETPSVYRNTGLAGKFSGIPDKNCPSEYINTIFEAAIKSGEIRKLNRLFNSIAEADRILTPSNIWKYIYLCREASVYDASVFKSCRKLLKSGWVDIVTVQVMNKLKELHIAQNTDYEDRILELYGYESK